MNIRLTRSHKVRFFQLRLCSGYAVVMLLSLPVSVADAESMVTLPAHISQFLDDSQITARVKSALLNHAQLPIADLRVTTSDGYVTIQGRVEQEKHRREIQRLSCRVLGVKHVSNLVKIQSVKPDSIKSYARDLAITSEIKTRLLADKKINSTHVNITTHQQHVTISGRVSDRRQKLRVSQLIHKVADVIKVDNNLIISSH